MWGPVAPGRGVKAREIAALHNVTSIQTTARYWTWLTPGAPSPRIYLGLSITEHGSRTAAWDVLDKLTNDQLHRAAKHPVEMYSRTQGLTP